MENCHWFWSGKIKSYSTLVKIHTWKPKTINSFKSTLLSRQFHNLVHNSAMKSPGLIKVKTTREKIVRTLRPATTPPHPPQQPGLLKPEIFQKKMKDFLNFINVFEIQSLLKIFNPKYLRIWNLVKIFGKSTVSVNFLRRF